MSHQPPTKTNEVDLNEIVNISEAEFKQQITNWIEDHGVSKALQSKLRADLFEQFNKTNLGRQIALKHQNANRLVFSPLLLVLNTLVAEFLYSEDCHFSLSVFATEVPFKNTIPDFEGRAKSNELFRFTKIEMTEMIEALQIKHADIQMRLKKLYTNENEFTAAANTSLLYCIFKAIHDLKLENNLIAADVKELSPENLTNSSGVTKNQREHKNEKNQLITDCPNCNKSNSEKFQINSRYFKYLNRYLDILSDRIHEMSESLARRHSKKSQSKTVGDSVHLENSIQTSISKMQEQLADLSKSKKKHKNLQDIINSIERLSSGLEKCSGNFESLMSLTHMTAKELKAQKDMPGCEKDTETYIQDYSTWLHKMRASENGKKFIARLESSLQRTLEKEKEVMKKSFDDKMENYRLLIKMHYKQKYSGAGGRSDDAQKPLSSHQSHRKMSKNVENGKQTLDAIPSSTTVLKNILNTTLQTEEGKQLQIHRELKERHVDSIVESAK